MTLQRIAECLSGRVLWFVPACMASVLLPACRAEKPAAAQPPTVEVVEVLQKDVPVYTEWVATMDGLVNATIRAQVQGYLMKQSYQEGDFVRKGDLLFEIDPQTRSQPELGPTVQLTP